MLLALLLTCCLNAPPETTLDTDTITAGAILPLPASDPRAGVILGYAPSPGLARRIPNYEIQSKIKSAGFGLDGLELPDSILVRRRAQSLDAKQVRQAISEAYLKQFSGANVELLNVEVPSVQIGTGPVRLAATLPGGFDPKVPVFVRLEVRGDDFSRTVFVRTVARIEAVQPVIQRHVAANSEIHREDVEWTPAPLETNAEILTSFEALEGMLAKRDLEPGQVLKKDLVYLPLYVRKGESVTVKAISGGVTISATMRAKTSGRLGETISVEHLTGTGSITARVVGPRTLEAIQR